MELGPLLTPADLRVSDLLDEPLDELRLGVQQRDPEVLFDQEERVDSSGKRCVDQSTDLGALGSEPP